MAKEYGRKSKQNAGGSFMRLMSLVFVAFLCGYLSASVLDFTQLSSWVGSQLHGLYAEQTSPSKPAPVKQAALPKPKFEFYTLLAKDQAASPVTASQSSKIPPAASALTEKSSQALSQAAPVIKETDSVPVVAAKPIQPAVAAKDLYRLQVGSFRSKQEAERMKAALTLKGFQVQIAAVTQQKNQWYRVFIGPYPSRGQAEKARGALANQERIQGMIRRMDA